MASQDQVDPNPLNNSGAASVNAAPNADLSVTKAVSDAAPAVGALVTYTVAVTNLGPSAATSAEILDVTARRRGVRVGDCIGRNLRPGQRYLDGWRDSREWD